MLTKLTEQDGCIIVKFIDQRRFTLISSDEVKSELKPFLLQKGSKLVFDLQNIEFIDSSAIGCMMTLSKMGNSNHSEIKFCNLSQGVIKTIDILRVADILDIEKDIKTSIQNFSK
ncbi:MAG: STAS domain-containing protein [Odoribacter sp.]